MISIMSNNDSVKSTHNQPSYGVICVLCLQTKTCTSVKSDPKHYNLCRNACMRYVMLVSKYFKFKTSLTKYYKELQKRFSGNEFGIDETNEPVMRETVNKFTVCDSCFPITESFCNNYEAFEILRMKLEDNVLETNKIVEKSKLNSNLNLKRPKLHKSLQKANSETDDILTDFRTKLKDRGRSLTESGLPRVYLKRNAKADQLSKARLLKTPHPYPSLNKASHQIFIRNFREISQDNESVNSLHLNFNNSSTQATGKSGNDNDIEIINEIPRSNKDGFNQRNISQVQPNLFPTVPVGASNTVCFVSGQNTTDFSFLEGVNTVDQQICKINGCQHILPKSMRGSLDMQRHLQSHSNWFCQICSEVLDSPLQFINHQLKHSKNDQPFGFNCPMCGDFSSLRTEYKEHFFLKHLNSTITLMKCPICWKGYQHTKQKELETHIANCHPENIEDLSNCHECDICHVYFRKQGSLWKHLKNDHRINCDRGIFKCNYCSNSYNSPSYLQMHKKFACDKVPDFLRKCPHPNCAFESTTTRGLSDHLRQHNEPLPGCPICNLKFKDERSMKCHVMTHNGEQVKFVMPNGNNNSQIQPIVVPVQNQVQLLPQETETPFIVSTQSLIPSSALFGSTNYPLLPFAIPDESVSTVDFEQGSMASLEPEACLDPLPSTSFDCSFEKIENFDPSRYFDDDDDDTNGSEHMVDFAEVKDDFHGVTIANEDPFAWMIPDESGM